MQLGIRRILKGRKGHTTAFPLKIGRRKRGEKNEEGKVAATLPLLTKGKRRGTNCIHHYRDCLLSPLSGQISFSVYPHREEKFLTFVITKNFTKKGRRLTC